MAAARSPMLGTLYASVEAARHGQIWGDLKRRSASSERRRRYQADHHEIRHLRRVSDHLNATDPAAAVWQQRPGPRPRGACPARHRDVISRRPAATSRRRPGLMTNLPASSWRARACPRTE